MKPLFCLAALLAIVATTSSAWAQLSTSSGTFGSRTFGTGVSGASGGSQINRSQGLTQSGQVTAEGAVQRQAGGFVGASSSNMTNVRSAATSGLGQGGLGGFGSTFGSGLGNSFGRFGFGGIAGGQQNAQNLNAETQTRGDLRIPISLGFARPTSVATASAASSRLTQRLKNIRQVEAVGTIAVSSVGRTVVLRGTVATEQARDLAGRVALLEPGVSEVQNELVVAETAPLPLEN